jgi:Zn-dependent protease with chaperone function
MTELRIPKESELLEKIKRMPSFPDLKKYWDHYMQEHDPRRAYLASGLRLSKTVAPKIYQLKKMIQKIIQTSLSLELYVYADPSINASCVRAGDNELIVAMTSTLVEKLDPRELLFVLGHEIGHTLLEHDAVPGARYAFAEEENKPSNVALGLYLLAWSRYAEISADRVGLLCCQNTDSAGSAFVKWRRVSRKNTLDSILMNTPHSFPTMSALKAKPPRLPTGIPLIL